METGHNKSMKRQIELKDPKIMELYGIIQSYQKEVNPAINEMNAILEKKEELKKPFNDYSAEVEPRLKELNELLTNFDQRASAVKEKIAPLVRNEIEPVLEDEEDFEGIELKDGVMYANLFNAIEKYREIFMKNKYDRANTVKKEEVTEEVTTEQAPIESPAEYVAGE